LIDIARNGHAVRSDPLLSLDERLAAAFFMFPACKTGADIGADHGKLSAALLHSGRVCHMLVSDKSRRSLEKARRCLQNLKLADMATCVTADGIAALHALKCGKADCICILGMGGSAIVDILAKGWKDLQGATLVLGPHSATPLVRQALVQNDYRLREERLASVSNRLYVLLRAEPAEPGEAEYSEKELWLGPCLMREKPHHWKRMLLVRLRLLECARQAMENAGRCKDQRRHALTRRELVYLREELKGLGDN
jgi:tRNA (adenine22-N1)-methyltransferase